MRLSFILNFISFVLLVAITIFVIKQYPELPKIIPIHFGVDGKPDGFGAKSSILFLLAISFAVFCLMSYLSVRSNSQFLNIPQNIKEHPKVAANFVGFINLIISAMFCYIVYETIQVAKQLTMALGNGIFVFLGFLFLTLIIMMIYSRRLTTKSKV